MGPIPPALPSHLIGMRVGEWLGNSVLGGGVHKGKSFGKGVVLTFPLWVSGDVLTCIFNLHIFRIWFVANRFVSSHSDGQRGTKPPPPPKGALRPPPCPGRRTTGSAPEGAASPSPQRIKTTNQEWSGGRRQCTQGAAGLTDRMRRGGALIRNGDTITGALKIPPI